MRSGRIWPRTAALAAAASLFVTCAQERALAEGNVKAGRAKAEKCEVCHGLDGLAKIAEAPNLAGQNERYLFEQLTAFKAGDRRNEMMSVVIGDLSEADIADLAAYYAAIPISVGKPPGD